MDMLDLTLLNTLTMRDRVERGGVALAHRRRLRLNNRMLPITWSRPIASPRPLSATQGPGHWADDGVMAARPVVQGCYLGWVVYT